jgi:uncharacterized protein (TIGR02996 family)
MTDADRFLATIIATPDDDVPRLVFADWLEEHGDADRAEFIRLQCAIARDGARPGERERADALQAANRKRWKVQGIPGRQLFRRGFVEYLHIAADDLLRYADHIGRSAPVTHLRLSAASDRTVRLLRIDWIGRLRSLEIHNEAIGPQLRHFIHSGVFTELKSLSLRNNRLWSDYIAILGGLAEHLPKLERIDLGGNPIGDEGLAHLAATPSLAGLRDLILPSDGIDEEYRITEVGIEALVQSQSPSRLRTLVLTDQRIGDRGFIRLVESPIVRDLAILDVTRNGIGLLEFGWAEAMLRSPYLSNLMEFRFRGNDVAPPAMILRHWGRLRAGCTVDLRDCHMDSQTARLFRDSDVADRFLLDGDET